jgi:hypothetical protein
METAAALQPALDLDASPVPGQQASAVLTAAQGHVVLVGNLDAGAVTILWRLWVESAAVAADDGVIERLSVSYGGQRYVVTRDEQHVYMVQTRTE